MYFIPGFHHFDIHVSWGFIENLTILATEFCLAPNEMIKNLICDGMDRLRRERSIETHGSIICISFRQVCQ
jgi:hypothetical protein